MEDVSVEAYYLLAHLTANVLFFHLSLVIQIEPCVSVCFPDMGKYGTLL